MAIDETTGAGRDLDSGVETSPPHAPVPEPTSQGPTSLKSHDPNEVNSIVDSVLERTPSKDAASMERGGSPAAPEIEEQRTEIAALPDQIRPSSQQDSTTAEAQQPTETPRVEDDEAACPFQLPEQAPPQPMDDLNSDLGSEVASLTETINSLNYQYRYDAGRRFHGFDNAAYLLPNDEREQERLEGQHQTWILVLGGKLHVAPLRPDIQNVLDVATGTGNWAMDFADEYPSAKVVGTDLSPIQPNLKSVPPNCSFIVEDSEDEWVWEERFDFIHSRTLGSTWRDWPGYFRKCMEFLQPGGWLEMHEFTFPFHCEDGSCPRDNPMMAWSIYFNEACAKGGVDQEVCADLDPLLRDAGFVNVTKTRHRLAFTGWSSDPDERRTGYFYGKIFDWGVSIRLFTRRLGWTRERAELFLMEARREAAKLENHVYIPLYIYTARKPE